MAQVTMKLALVRSDVEVHGLKWAAQRQQAQFKRNPTGANSFDTFYFALFGKWPTRCAGKK